jgi:uncharacterized protein (TIGR02996 family)
MTRADSFLQVIRDDPDDDTPRLVYADYLEEHGGAAGAARAEFIRAQVALARLGDDDSQRPALADRERALLAEHKAAWLQELPDLPYVCWGEFHRGFMASILMVPVPGTRGTRYWYCLRTHVPPAFAVAPVEHVGFATPMRIAGAQELAGMEWLARIRRLDLKNHQIGPQGLAALLQSPFLGRPQALDLEGNAIGTPGARKVAECQRLSEVRELRVGTNDLADDGVEAIAKSRYLSQLTLLDVSSNGVAGRGLYALADSRNLVHLQHLSLSYNRLEAVPLRRLVSSRRMPRLRHLEIGGCNISNKHAVALAEAGRAGLATLDISFNPLGPAGARALASSPLFAGLTALDLSQTRPGDDGIRALADSPGLADLAVLDLGSAFLRPAAAEAIAASAHLANLTCLRLSNNSIGDAGARALAASPHLTRLTALEVSYNDICEEGKRLLQERFPFVRT